MAKKNKSSSSQGVEEVQETQETSKPKIEGTISVLEIETTEEINEDENKNS